MDYLMGIDIGTSGLKTIIMSEEGQIIASAFEGYGVEHPKPRHAEQNPETWWRACAKTTREALDKSGINRDEIACIGFSGQMHSAVALDKHGDVIRPAIIWCDQRSSAQVDRLYHNISKKRFGEITLNPAFPGFTIMSLMWMKENEPRNYERVRTVLLPKDYIRYKLTGEFGTDIIDASGTMCFDPVAFKWSDEVLSAAGIDKNIFPKVSNPYSPAGKITKKASLETGLKAGTSVVTGGGDQPMQAVGNGIISTGTVSSTIGTGGQIYTPVETPIYDEKLRTHTFCSAISGKWNLIGGTLSAGLSLKWLKESVLDCKSFAELDEGAANVPAGSNGLIFLPYLAGERTPHMDALARGMFFGLTLQHTGFSMARAVMEGVAFSLKDSLEIFGELGIKTNKIIASGGGAKSRLWKKIQADVFGREIYTSKTDEQACTGAAIMAAVGCGMYASIEEACQKIVTFDEEIIEPDMANAAKYQDAYGIYKKLYEKNADLFKNMQTI